MAEGSASKLARFRRCKHAFYFSDVLELQRKKKGIAPSRGTLIHACLQAHYSGGDWTKPIEEFKVEWDKLFDEERAEWGDLPKETYRIIRGYLLAYKTADSKLKTIGTEIEFSFKFGRIYEHTYKGIIDWLYEDEQGVWVCDHKTVKVLPSEIELYMDLQTLLYYEACRRDEGLKKLLDGKKLAGVVFNHIRTKAPKEPQVLKSGGLSKAACDTDVATYFETVKKNGLDINDYKDMLDKLKENVFYRRVKIPVSEKTLKILMSEADKTLCEIDEIFDLAFPAEDVFPRTMLSLIHI